GANDEPQVTAAVTTTATKDDGTFNLDLLTGSSDIDTTDVLNVENIQLVSGDGTGITDNGNSLDIDPASYSTLADGETATIVYSYDITDGKGGSVSQTATIIISGTNLAPVAWEDAVMADEDNSISGDVLADNGSGIDNDSDPGDSLTVTAVNAVSGNVGTQITLASGALLTLNADGNFDYDPNGAFEFLAASESTTDSFTYTIDDGHGGTDTATVTITINGVNDSPTAVDDSLVTTPNDPNSINILSDATGTQFDGDSDGTPGGAYDFWFVASDSSNTLYVDKTNVTSGSGTLNNPFSTIESALNNVTSSTQVVRILGNGGTDGDLRTTNDSDNYLIGYDDNFNPLEDGESIIVPQGVTVIIDQGAVIKLQNTVIDVGSSSTLDDRSNAALQILGTPDAQVVLTAYGNDAVGGDDDGPSDGANPGDWGGIIFRADSDYEEDAVFLNYIANADISYGGGQVLVNSVLQSIAPIHIDEARPTLAYNTITHSSNAAISADPNSFDATVMKGGEFNHDQTLKRVGPDIYGNTILDNSLNGLFIRSETLFGQDIDKVNVTARFDDTDITHIITENLFVEAGTGGPVMVHDDVTDTNRLQTRYSGSVIFDAGMVVKLGGSRIQTGRGNAGIYAEGTEDAPVVFTSLFDDRYGAGGTFDTTNNDSRGVNERVAQAGDWGGIILNQTSHGSIDHAIIAYAGGFAPVEGFSDSFNPIEVHQADLRVTNTLFENNAGIASSTDRNGLGSNEATTIFVRGAQPIIVNNQFVNNSGSVININANSLKSDILDDYGRSTGVIDAFDYLDSNAGPLVRLNQFQIDDPELSGILGMVVRGELLTVESVWDDTDIDHVLYDTITVDNFHTYGGLRLQSATDASLVVKFGSGAGFTATGHGLDINDRIGGIVQILGNPQNPVVLTSLFDDTIGSGIGLDGYSVIDSIVEPDSAPTIAPAAGDWTGLQFLEMSHDRNVAIYNETELAVLDGNGDINGIIRKAQFLGELAPDEKSGDENRRLGFEVHGTIAGNNSGDADIYSFNAEAGTQVWIDIDRTGLALDSVIELLDPLGRIIASATNNTDAVAGTAPFATIPNPLIENINFGGDFYSSNPKDAGMRIVLPGMDGILTTYFVRVRSNGGDSNGEYQLQVRLRQVDEEPGSTVRYSDIRYAANAIYLAGLPAHSPLINETVENGDAESSTATQSNLGNLLTSDRNTLGVSGNLSSEADIDFYEFEITLEDIQAIEGVNAGGKTWATVFDIDYADGLGRADTTLSVFDSEGRLIFVSRESNVADDQHSGSADADDITRGSFGTQDPYIGSVHLPEAGTYYVAVSSNTRLATALEATYNGTNPNALVRLEPINSLQRIVEDHIGALGYTSNGVNIEPDGGLFDITDGEIDSHVTGFELSDVVLFTTNGINLSTIDPQIGNTETSIGNVTGTDTDHQISDIVMRSDGRLFGIINNQLIEIDTSGNLPDNNIGTINIASISGNQSLAAAIIQSTDNLSRQLNLLNHAPTDSDTRSIEAMTYARVGDNGTTPTYELYYAVTETGRDFSGTSVQFQKLYEANPTTGAIIGNSTSGTLVNGFRGYLLQGSNITSAYVSSDTITDTNSSPRSGTLYFESVVPGERGDNIDIIFEHGTSNAIDVTTGTITITLDGDSSGSTSWNIGQIVAQINDSPSASQYIKAGMLGNSSTNGYQALELSSTNNTVTYTTDNGIGTPDFDDLVTGMAFKSFNSIADGGTPLYGVTENGNVLEIDVSSTDNTSVQLKQTSDFVFSGAALGPQNLFQSTYKNYVFAVDEDGSLVALDTNNGGAMVSVFGSNGDKQSAAGSIASTGIAFSPLDFNLWHTTRTQGEIAGHGINTAPDNSRSPSATPEQLAKLEDEKQVFNESNGAISFYFGLEQFNDEDNTYLSYEAASAQLGILNADFLRDLTSNSAIGNNVNLPGGALGSLTTDTFSLAGYGAKDAPTMYFNYFLDTENTNSSDTNQMRDSARVYLQDAFGNWHLIATNNSTKSTSDTAWELPTYITHTAAENTNSDDTGRDYVQELFDDTNVWRQARIDLSAFAGQSDLKLRFDYSTAGTIGEHGDFDSDIHGVVDPAFNSSRRGQNNTGEGFFIDDIIIGFAERGEMVTNSDEVATFFDVNNYVDVNGNSNQIPDGASDQILAGSYNLEIRRATEYAILGDKTSPLIGVAQLFDTNDRLVEEDGLLGDDNFRREQGMILIEGNQIFNSSNGIVVNTIGPLDSTDGLPHQGGTRVLPNPNTQQLVPGAVLQNNLIVNSTSVGINITGNSDSPESVIPVVKVINNTIYGGLSGINIDSRVSPTIVNNIIANTANGITIVTSGSAAPVVDANLFQFRDDTNVGTLGTNAIKVLETEALFVDAAAGNFYLSDNSKAIDSSLNRLADRPLFTAVKTPLGIPASDVFAPTHDVFGQLRVDDPTQSPPPGLGANVFKDKGAIERADFVGPTARITLPLDNDVNNVDRNSNLTEVLVLEPQLFTTMIVKLRDNGIGVDDSLVNSAQFTLTAQTSTSQRLLLEGDDYLFSYNSNTNEAIFTSIDGVFSLDTLYTINVRNTDYIDINNPALNIIGIKDLAGNSLQPNRAGGITAFTVGAADENNDPPVNRFDGASISDPGSMAVDLGLSTEFNTPFHFAEASQNILSVSDPDAFLGDGNIEVTLEADTSQGTLYFDTLLTLDGLTVNQTVPGTIILTGSVADVNDQLQELVWTPSTSFYNDTATLTITTSDLENFDGMGTAEEDTDQILISVGDAPLIYFDSSSYTVDEAGTLTVTLRRDLTGIVAEGEVAIVLLNGDTEAADFTDSMLPASNYTFEFGEFEDTATFTVTLNDDDLVELDETFDLMIISTNLDGGSIDSVSANNTTTVTITDNDSSNITITPQFDSSDNEVTGSEDSGTLKFTITLSNAIDADIALDVATILGGTATSDVDYTAKSEQITISAGDTSATFTVSVNPDNIVELSETVFAQISNLTLPTGYDDIEIDTTGLDTAVGTIDDNDSALVSIEAVSGSESNRRLRYKVSLLHPLDDTIDVTVSESIEVTVATITGGSATSGDDYTPTTETITFTPGGPTEFFFDVPVIDDQIVELDENQTVQAMITGINANGYAVTIDGSNNTATETIVDNDTAVISIQSGSVGSEVSGEVEFRISLSKEVEGQVTVDAVTVDNVDDVDAASVGFDYTSVSTPQLITFDEGDTLKFFTVTVTNDDLVELQEKVFAKIDNAMFASGFNGKISIATTDQATGFIQSEDFAVISIDSPSVAEGTPVGSTPGPTDLTELTFNVNISKAVAYNVSVDLSTQDGTATVADNDYLPIISQRIIFAGTPENDSPPLDQLNKPITVQIPQDRKVELEEMFNLIMDNLQRAGLDVRLAAHPVTGVAAEGTIENDDVATISINHVSQRESDGDFVFTATLSRPVDEVISVDVYTAAAAVSPLLDDSDYNAIAQDSPITITFTPNGSLTQNFTITVNDDNIVEDKEFFSILMVDDSLVSENREVTFTPGIKQGEIINDDSAILSIIPVTGTENDSPFQFRVELSNPVDIDITVDAATSDGSAIASKGDYLATFKPLTFEAGVTQLTVDVPVFPDLEVESLETFNLTLDTLEASGRSVYLTSIQARGGTATTDAAIAVDVVGDYAYIADRDGGLQIFNISNPSSPVHVGAYDFAQQGIAQGIDVVGNLAYLAVGVAGLQIIDISNPENPTFVGSIATPARARGVYVEVDENNRTLAYVADDSGFGGGLQIIDVSDPHNVGQVDSFGNYVNLLGSFGVNSPGGLAGGVFVKDDIAYITDGNNGLHIIDVSDPTLPAGNMTLHQTVATPGGSATGLHVAGDFAYVANREGGVQIIDISDPMTASRVGSWETPGIATGVRVVGNFAYVTDGTFGLQVIDISQAKIVNTFDTHGHARSLFVSDTLAFVADTFGGLQILEFIPATTATGTILDPAGPPLTGTASPNTTISTSLVTTPTTTSANGETDAVPDSVAWIDEWDSFWVEVWGNTSDGSGISGGNFDLEYNTDYFTATAVEFGSAFAGSSTASIDDQTGIITGISGQNSQSNLGGSGQVLLARVKFESLGEDNVVIDRVSGFLGPHSLGIRVVNASLDVSDFGGVTASTGETLNTELWAVPFDLNDDGTINHRDLIKFTSYYGMTVAEAKSGLAWSLDFDKSGKINHRDLIYLVNNYSISRGTGQQISFPANFPQEWYGTAITTEGSDTLTTLIDAATEEWKTATGNPDLTVQVVVTDLGGQQLGEGHILELDENGIPVKGRVYIDDDAAGLGWYSSVEGLAFDSSGLAIAGSAAEGHYDLYTVLLHEIGHAAGFTTSYSAYTKHVETSDSGQVQFVSWDFLAPLTEDGLHIDETFDPNDIMGATLDPSSRKMISTLDIQILQAAYDSAQGAVITPLSAPLMASSLQAVSTTEPVAPVTKPVVAPEQQQLATVASKSSGLQADTLPAWYLAPQLPLSSSSLIVEQSVDQDLLIGSLFEVSYDTDLSDDLEPEETTLELNFHPDFDLDDIQDSEVADEELDSLFADWSGPLV
ncbi:Calx-beta domain-containing protein, partial [Gimesia sp.]|uniref:Calx-beta domain-containing protein n=1 Tax=Gimesia sp. TaxID=2024833 RepID=UPI003A8EFAA1